MTTGKAKIQPSYRALRGLYLGVEFMRKADLEPGRVACPSRRRGHV